MALGKKRLVTKANSLSLETRREIKEQNDNHKSDEIKMVKESKLEI